MRPFPLFPSMTRRRLGLLAFALLVPFGAAVRAETEAPSRIVSLGGSVTEIIFALGQQDRLIARDTTSTYPVAALDLPDVGYVRALSPEGVLSVDPDLILAIEGSGPPETMEVLQAANVPVVMVPEGYDTPAVLAKITVVADALGLPEAGAALASQVEADIAQALPGSGGAEPRVLFILSLQGGRIMAAGAETAAEGIITMAGGVNAMEGFDGYKPVSDEAILIAAPDVILMMDRSGDHAVSDDQILAHPALGQTPAGASGAIVRQSGRLMLGFGPRTADAVTALNAAMTAATR